MRSFNGHLRGLSILLGSMASSVTQTSYPYLKDGPCGVSPVAHYTVMANVVNAANETQAQRKLSITVTLPAHGTDSTSWQISRSPPYPVIFFFNGFLLKPAYYSAYASRLATWGYAVVQYDTGRWPILKDRQELPIFQQLIDWLSTQSGLKEAIDLGHIGVAGHSRGAKLAALHFASGQSSVKAAFLVDPVDNTRETPESVDYPSAAKALKLANRPVGIAGASVITGCNPVGSNWEHFWPNVGDGSWLLEVNGASHNTFLRASWLMEKALDLLCKRGPTSHEDTIGLTMPAMTAWIDKELRGVQMATTDDQQSLK
ncbi:MAG: hypothetical protein FRX49_00773, partial [Trebouxia sp. A1-2]